MEVKEAFSQAFPKGSKLPEFNLKDTAGNMLTNDFFNTKASLVVFTCNHCPYVKGSDKMLIDTVHSFLDKGLKAVFISSNDAAQYPEDSYEKMIEKSNQYNFQFPYLYDQTQEIAKSFDAACTPECYLFNENQELVFHGTINDNPREPEKASKNYIKTAIESVLNGDTPNPAFVNPLGCSIKWRV